MVMNKALYLIYNKTKQISNNKSPIETFDSYEVSFKNDRNGFKSLYGREFNFESYDNIFFWRLSFKWAGTVF